MPEDTGPKKGLATHQPDPIDTTMTTLEEEAAQLQAENEEIMSHIPAIEESSAAL
jgi:hypothetical protein